MNQPRKDICAVFLAISLAMATGCAATLPNQSAGEYLDDAVITTKVKASMVDQPTLKASQIHVETFKGTVYLSGLVASQVEINKAGEVARGINGVRAVKNELRLR
jgi:osmotically-inducible protein OsmY